MMVKLLYFFLRIIAPFCLIKALSQAHAATFDRDIGPPPHKKGRFCDRTCIWMIEVSLCSSDSKMLMDKQI
jgi:hypothetical protein